MYTAELKTEDDNQTVKDRYQECLVWTAHLKKC
ncbi:MAG: hypothetical protein ACJAUR_001737 [Ulvibacter sp.]|jgi:hypothetical protein